MKKIKIIINHLLILVILTIYPLTLSNLIDANAFIDFTIFIDAGHGGRDNGASYLNIYEDEINLSIAEKLYEKCLNKNLIAYMSRTGDYDLASLYAKNRKNEDLKRRSQIINHSGSDVFISLHVNYYQDENVNGPMVYYKQKDDQSFLFAKSVQKELNTLLKKDKVVHEDSFYLFKYCTIPGILIETGFISNEDERVRLLDKSYQESLVDAIYQGIYNYYLSS